MARKGRKRSMYREPSGKRQRPSAQERVRDMTAVVLEARQRVHGVSEPQARAMPETTVLGRLRATGEISMRQYEAGARYGSIVRAYDAAMLARPLPKAGDLDRGGGHDGADPFGGGDPERRALIEDSHRTKVRRFEECEAALVAACREDRMARAVVNAIALSDLDAPAFVPQLRVGLNHLARIMRLPIEDEEDPLDIPRKSAQVQNIG